jgi:hypothetical protein
MKKLFFFLLSLSLTVGLFAQNSGYTEATVFAQEPMYMDFGDANTPQLSLYANSTKAVKSEDRKWPAFILNFLVGLGIGSYVQGDGVGGTIGLVGTLGSYAVIISGISGVAIGDTGGATMAVIGSATLLGTRIFGLIRPFTYANKYSFGFVPTMSPDGEIGLTAAVGFKF